MAQMVEWFLPTREICVSNPVIGKFYFLSTPKPLAQAKPIFAKPNFDQNQAKFWPKPSQANFAKPGHKQYRMPSNKYC